MLFLSHAAQHVCGRELERQHKLKSKCDHQLCSVACTQTFGIRGGGMCLTEGLGLIDANCRTHYRISIMLV